MINSRAMKLVTLASFCWLAGCAVTHKQPLELPGVNERSDGGVSIVLTPEQWNDCKNGGGCLTVPLSNVDPSCIGVDPTTGI